MRSEDLGWCRGACDGGEPERLTLASEGTWVNLGEVKSQDLKAKTSLNLFTARFVFFPSKLMKFRFGVRSLQESKASSASVMMGCTL